MLLFDEAHLAQVVDQVIQRRLDPILTALVGRGPERNKPDLLTREQLADVLLVDERTLRRLILEGPVPAPMRLGDRIQRWRRADVDAWLAADGIPASALPPRRRTGSVSANGDRRS